MLLGSSWPNGHLMTPLEYACHGVSRGSNMDLGRVSQFSTLRCSVNNVRANLYISFQSNFYDYHFF